MDGRDGVNSELQAGEILWVGRAGLDPYWDRCRDRFDLADFDSVYEAVAEVLTGRNACALVLNATFLGTEVKSIVKTILAQNLFSCVCLYSTVPNFPAIAANGDARLLPVADPDDLVDRLSRVLQHAPEISKEEAPRAPAPVAESPKLPPPQPAESPEPIWPGNPPSGAVPVPASRDREGAGPTTGIKPDVKNETASVKSTPPAADPSTAGAFCPAELTPDELRALLGPDPPAGKKP